MSDQRALDTRNEASGLDEWESTPLVTRDGRLQLEMTRASDGARLTLEIGQANSGDAVLVPTQLGDISYSQIEGIDGHEAAKIVKSFGKVLEAGEMDGISTALPHLLIGPDGRASGSIARRLLASVVKEHVPLLPSPDELVDRRERPSSMLFDPQGLVEFLDPEVRIDGDPLLDYVLRTVSYPSVVPGKDQAFDVCLLEFERDERLTRIRIGTRDAFVSAFGVTPHFAVYVEPDRSGHGDHLSPEVAGLASLLVAILASKDSTLLEVTTPRSSEQVRSYTLPSLKAVDDADDGGGAPAGRSLNLAIDAECGQACAFCSVKWTLEPEDGGQERLDRALADLRRSRADGVTEVRLNGIDPLGFSRVLDVVRAVRDQGFERLLVYSTCRRLADPGFAREFSEVAPDNLTITVPVYGTTPEVHDAVTGVEGSHAEVMQAIDNIRQFLPHAELRISTVVVKANLHQFSGIVRIDNAFLPRLDPHLPYPMRESSRDPYVDAVVRESEIAESVLSDPMLNSRTETALARLIPHPCILWHARNPGRRVAVRRVAAGHGPRYMAGTWYASPEFVHGGGQDTPDGVFSPRVVPCPKRRGCALAGDCPAEMLAQYIDLFGTNEFKPVTWPELIRHLGVVDIVGSLATVGSSDDQEGRRYLLVAIATVAWFVLFILVIAAFLR